jgi:hypothetical protein
MQMVEHTDITAERPSDTIFADELASTVAGVHL